MVVCVCVLFPVRQKQLLRIALRKVLLDQDKGSSSPAYYETQQLPLGSLQQQERKTTASQYQTNLEAAHNQHNQ